MLKRVKHNAFPINTELLSLSLLWTIIFMQ